MMVGEKSKHQEKVLTLTSPQQRDEELNYGGGVVDTPTNASIANEELNFAEGIDGATYANTTDSGLDLAGVANMPQNTLSTSSPHFPLSNLHGIPQSSPQDILLPGVNLISDTSLFNDSLFPVVGHDSSLISDWRGLNALGEPTANFLSPQGNTNEFHHHYSFENFVPSGNLEMCRRSGEFNTSNARDSQFIRNSISYGGSPAVLSHTPDVRDMQRINNTMAGAVDSDFPKITDGSFLTLGVGDNRSFSCKSNLAGRDITRQTDGVVFSQSIMTCSQNSDRSSLNSVPQLGGRFPCFQNTVGGFSRETQNLGGFSSLADNFGRGAISNNDIGVMGSTSSHFNMSSSHMLQPSQGGNQQYLFRPDPGNLVSQRNGDGRFTYLPFPPRSPLPVGANQALLPNSGQCGGASLITSSSIPLTSEPLQNFVIGTARDLSYEPRMVSPLVAVTRSTPRQVQTRQELAGYHGGAIQTCQGGVYPQRLGLHLGNHTGYHAIPHVQPSNIPLSPAYMPGQMTPVANQSLHAQVPNVVVSSRKRVATQSPDTPQVQCKKTRSAVTSIRQSTPDSGQAAASLLSLPKSAPPVPILPRSHFSGRVLRTAALPPPLPSPIKTSPPVHIRRQGSNRTPQPLGVKCYLCKRDVSFTPDGPVYHPSVPPPVAVLSCGHCFHDHCLKLITSEDQAHNPPCIPCAIGDT